MGRSSPSIGRSATIVAWRFGLLESQKASISDSVGPHRLKNRRRYDFGRQLVEEAPQGIVVGRLRDPLVRRCRHE